MLNSAAASVGLNERMMFWYACACAVGSLIEAASASAVRGSIFAICPTMLEMAEA
ncbi:MAG: hypothetical protein QM796_08275 [Chthoniobacteraceae bacterium]